MSEQKPKSALPYERRRQVLGLLAEHGPLSAGGIMACLPRQSSARALRKVLHRLYARGILARRHDQATGRVFHQIGQNPLPQRRAAEILGVKVEGLKQPHFRHAELLHSEECAVWTELLRLLFPQASVRRDFQFAADKSVNALLLSSPEERDMLPDILLRHEAEPLGRSVQVAVEIERTMKGKKRLLRKLRKYATQTRLDGVIYVTQSSSLQSRLLDVYESKVVKQALRIGHYGRHFLLFTSGSFDRTRGEPRMFNSALEPVSLRDWMSILLETKHTARRDEKFQHGSSPRNHVSPLEISGSLPLDPAKPII